MIRFPGSASGLTREERLAVDGQFGDIESVKATNELISGVGGTVMEINTALAKDPGLVNRDPYAAGWMIKVKADNPGDVGKLLEVKDYLAKTGNT